MEYQYIIFKKKKKDVKLKKIKMKFFNFLSIRSTVFIFGKLMLPFYLVSLCANFTKWPNTLKQFVGKLPANCLSVFDHFVGLALKGLLWIYDFYFHIKIPSRDFNASLKLHFFHVYKNEIFLVKTGGWGRGFKCSFTKNNKMIMIISYY